MKFQLLGPVTVRCGAESLPLGPGKQRALLVALLLDRGHVVPMERLLEVLWDGEPPNSAVSNIRTYASRLRGTIIDGWRRPRVHGRTPGYLIEVDDDELDTAVFANLAGAGHAALADGKADRAATYFRDALDLWHGAAGEDVPRSRCLDRRLSALDEQRLVVVEEWINARQQTHGDADLIADLRQLTESHPLRERLWGQLVLALYRVGDVGAALAAFQRARTVLIEDLGVEPGPDLVQLHQAVLARDPALGGPVAHPRALRRPVGAPRPVVTIWTPRELPVTAPTLIGRDREVASVVATVATRCGEGTVPAGEPVGMPAGVPAGMPTVVAIHGPSGAGASAVAIRAATELIPVFPDGQLYADLRTAGAAQVLGWFLRALGTPAGQVPSDVEEAAARFRSASADRRLLVLLDNATDEAQVRPLLSATSGSAAIVTSARKLAALDATAHVEVAPLGDDDAIRLLATLSGTGIRSAANPSLQTLVELCGGLPLALRIVAARLASAPDVPLERIAAELVTERHRFRALSCGDLRISYRSAA
ncbi:BTAD domain-containing putative transcriptional regulator [Dactylosporangium siamense]|uniref:AfsR/SARP family transcriptional regulator n=1 Tax=Dactylosporangium siamense TaxID=685454 RepID=UPI0019430C09|nr:AfsR/SARP family transcriptional regulator [Dactylosporangium siamense]